MGIVWRARDLTEDRAVAIKLLYDAEPDAHARFAREAKLLADLSHPGIVRYVDSGLDAKGAPWLAMEWIDGESLSARISAGRLGMRDAVLVVRRVAEALAAAHALGLVHRDVKPSNVLLPRVGLEPVTLIDFGIARRRATGTDTAGFTRTGVLVGTPGYAAPEQIRRAQVADARSDVFGLGCLLYTALTGRAAFFGTTPRAVLVKTLYCPPVAVRDFAPRVPEELAALAERMLEKAPADRPADAAEVARALAALGPLDNAAPPPPSRVDSAPTVRLAQSGGRFVTVVVVGWDDDESDEQLDEALAGRIEAVTAIGNHHGLVFEALSDGGLVARVIADAGSPPNVGGVARCALAIHAAEPAARIAVVSATAPDVTDAVLEDATRGVREATLAGLFADPDAVGAIRVCAQSARLLDGFQLEPLDGGFVLRGEAG